MELKLFIEAEAIEIKADRSGDSLTIHSAGKAHSFGVTELGSGDYLLRHGDKVHRITAIKNGNKIHVLTENESYAFELPAAKDSDHFGGEQSDHGDKSKIVAPMPGKVVKVLVKPGDTVEPKQKLVIVEAMKMENPLVAPYKAEVKSVNCADGELVDSERVLIELVKSE